MLSPMEYSPGQTGRIRSSAIFPALPFVAADNLDTDFDTILAQGIPTILTNGEVYIADAKGAFCLLPLVK